MKKLIFLLMVLGLVWCTAQASADIVCLKNGNIIEGIILSEINKTVELEVFLNAKITFSEADIAYIKKWDEEKNQALRKRWLKDKQERENAELARQEFEAEQKAKGLVQYEGKWIPEAEKDKLKTREYIDEILKSKIERGEVSRTPRKRTEISRSLLAKASWHSRQTEHFIVYYEDMIQSKMVADKAEYYYEKIAYDLDYEDRIYWPEKCEVFIIPSKEKWQQYMQEFVDRFDHIGGFVPLAEEKEIYLCALSLPYLSVTFPHELTHLIFNEFAKGKNIPLWLNEGLAIYESGLIGYADEILRDKVKEAKHISLKKMVELRDYPQTKEEVEVYYAQAEKTVEFLITQHGRKQFSRFCGWLISGQSFARALDLAYGERYYNQDQFERAWIKYVLR